MSTQTKIKTVIATGVLVLAIPLAGCSGELFVIESISAAISDKTASDHIVSLVSGKDCSFLRVEQDKSYCVEDAKIASQSHLYCYTTLASVTCYTAPHPQRAPAERIGYVDQSQTAP